MTDAPRTATTAPANPSDCSARSAKRYWYLELVTLMTPESLTTGPSEATCVHFTHLGGPVTHGVFIGPTTGFLRGWLGFRRGFCLSQVANLATWNLTV